MPKVSIILPSYNGSKYIKRAIESVLAQSFRDFELIIIDDGSADSTPEIAADFCRRDSRIVCLRNEKNLGIQKSLNRGLREAVGEYVARIDDDDFWSDPDKLAKQVAFLDSHPDHILVGTGTIVVDEKGTELMRYLLLDTDNKIRESILGKNYFTHSSVMFRRNPVLLLGGYSEREEVRHVEDYDLWLRLGRVGKLANMPFYGIKFTMRKDNLSSVNKTDQFKKDIALAWLYRKYYPNFFTAFLRSYLRLILYGLIGMPPWLSVRNRIFKFYKERY